MKRCVIFAHFDRNNQIADYVLFYLKELQKSSNYLVFVSTSQLNEAELKKLDGISCQNIIRENTGYDFLSWKVGLASVQGIEQYDEVVICNDSVFGPLKPLAEIFSKMSATDSDFWGLTNSLDVNEHIQSYFVVFKRNVVASKAFKNFWNSVSPLSSKHEVVSQYEINLTRHLAENGFKFCVVTNYKRKWALRHLPSIITRKLGEQATDVTQVLSKPTHRIENFSQKIQKTTRWISKFFNLAINPTQYAWKEVIKNGTPFIKVELLRDNPAHVCLDGWEDTVKSSNYFPTETIQKHLTNEVH